MPCVCDNVPMLPIQVYELGHAVVAESTAYQVVIGVDASIDIAWGAATAGGG